MLIIKDANLISIIRKASSGRTGALQARIMLDDTTTMDAVIKLSYGEECSIDSLRHEMLSSLLAGDLGLPILEPFFVYISDEFLMGYSEDNNIKARLEKSCRIAFGCKHLGHEITNFDCANYKLREKDIELFLGVFAFDAFIGNFDRYASNPNALINGDGKWFIIDHEMAFGFHRSIVPFKPWSIGGLGDFVQSSSSGKYIFFKFLNNQKLDFYRLKAKWCDISDERIAQYDAILPELWCENREWFERDLQHIKDIRNNIDGCIAELKRVLA